MAVRSVSEQAGECHYLPAEQAAARCFGELVGTYHHGANPGGHCRLVSSFMGCSDRHRHNYLVGHIAFVDRVADRGTQLTDEREADPDGCRTNQQRRDSLNQ